MLTGENRRTCYGAADCNVAGCHGPSEYAPIKTESRHKSDRHVTKWCAVHSFRSNGIKGVAVIAGGSASAEQNKPVQLEFYGGSGPIEDKSPAMKHSGSQGRRRMVSLMSMDLPDHDSTSRMNGLSRETRLSCREGLRSQGQARAVFCLRLRSLIRKRTPDLRWTILLQV